jgi:hypothetical protein
LTPRSPRRRSLRKNSVQNVSAFGRADVQAENLAPPVIVDTDGNDRRGRDDATILADLHIGGVNPQIRPVTLDRPLQERVDALVDLLTQPRHLAFGDAAHAHGLHEIVDRAGRNALDIGLLDHGGERLLGHPARLQKAGEIRALAQFRDP